MTDVLRSHQNHQRASLQAPYSLHMQRELEVGNPSHHCAGALEQISLSTEVDSSRPDQHSSTSGLRTRMVLDTSVLVADPNCLFGFIDVDVVVPLTVIEELDGLKARPDDVGRSARAALRTLEDLRVQHGGSLAEPVPVGEAGARVRIEINGIQTHLLVEHGLDPKIPDNRIIGAALGQATSCPTVMVSNDAALRIKAAHLGLQAAEHRPSRSSRPTRPVGWGIAEASTSAIDRLYAVGAVSAQQIPEAVETSENEFLVVRCGSQSALTQKVGNELVLLSPTVPEAWGLRPRNKEQRFAIELLLDPQITVVALDGRAGTGKTLLAIATGLEQVVEQHRYERVAVYRPLVPVGRADVGFLPGGLEEKLDPWMSAIHDAIVALSDGSHANNAGKLIEELTTRGQLSLESVTFLRGRSLQRQLIIVDEAQNLEPTTLKTILTRVGEGTKVIFTGDTSQIDAPYLGESNNALAVLTNAFAGQSCFGHITLTSCERSDVASLAAELL
jgi:PhoH-like ATPase